VNAMSEKFPVALKITGLDRIKEGLAAAPHELRVVANRVCNEEMSKVTERAKEIVPVRTGRLRNSIYRRKTGFLGWEVGATMFYAGFVEFGTRYMRARPYLRPAVEEKMPEVREELKDALIEKMLELLT
jgi:HK97 gp10 family phage protein